MNSRSTLWIKEIITSSMNTEFFSHVAQITSNAMSKEIAKVPTYNSSYNESIIVRNASMLNLLVENIALEDPKNLQNIGQTPLRLATLWENLSRLNEKTNSSTALINSAMCYQLAGYQANASCMAKKILNDLNNKKTIEFLPSLFLQRLFLQLRIECQKLMEEPLNIENEFESIKKLGIAYLANGFYCITDYFLRGDVSKIQDAEKFFVGAEDIFSNSFLIEEFNVARQVRCLIKPMIKTSTWKILRNILEKNPTWDRYLTLLARGIGDDILSSPSISEIWPSQIEAIESKLFESTSNKIIKMPTSAGKTRIAELAIVHMLAKNPNKKCIYVAPYRALVSELEDTFLNLFGDLGFRVSSIRGTFEQDPFEDNLIEDADILVLTPEKLDLILRSHSDLLKDVKLFILDEGHIIDDSERGIKLELLLTRLKRRMNQAQFILISAVLPDKTIKEYLAWFNGTEEDEIKSSWRPSIQLHSKFEWNKNNKTGTLRYEPRKDNKEIATFFSDVIEQREYVIKNKNTGRNNTTKFPDMKNKSNTAAELAFKFSELGPTLVFAPQKRFVRSIANSLLDKLKLIKDSGQNLPDQFKHNNSHSIMISKEWLGNNHEVTKLLQNGIAIHDGDLPNVLRRSIESDFRKKKFSVIISTTTLAQGVNLPIKTIIIHSCRRYDHIDKVEKRISANDYWNIAGRAGRAGQETEGTTIHIVNNSKDEDDYKFYLENKDKLEDIHSTLFQILHEIVEDRLNISSLREKIDSEILALLMEEGDINSSNLSLDDIIKSSLVSCQEKNSSSLKKLIKSFKTIAGQINDDISHDFIHTFASTGLSSKSCLILQEFIKNNEEKIKNFYLSEENNKFEFLELILSILNKIPEMITNSKHPENNFELMKQWIDGKNIDELIPNKELNKKTEITKFIGEYFEYLLPWGISSFLQISQKILGLDDPKIPNSIRYLSSMVKYGVPTPESCWCMMLGIPLRKLAIKLSLKYTSIQSESNYSKFIKWISNLSSEDLEKEFDVTSPFLEDIVKTLNRNGVNQLLKNKTNLENFLTNSLHISGIRYNNRHIIASKVQNDQDVDIIRDYANKYDRNAIKIITKNKSELGYLRRDTAQYLSPYIDSGLKFNAKIVSVIKERIPEIKIVIKIKD